MAGRLDGKVALVTGGARGIGAAIVARLAAEGARVALTYAGNTAAAEATVRAAGEGRATAIRADAADPASAATAVSATLAAFGRLDLLILNAGVAEFATLPDSDLAHFRKQFAVNVDGVFAAAHAAVAHLPDGGRIIVIGSVNADRMPTPGGAVYGATKAAVAGLVRGWARDLGPRGILVNVVQPGPVDTDMNPADGDFAGMLTPFIALGRYGRAEEVAATVAFLASDEASFITGAQIDVDGGFGI